MKILLASSSIHKVDEIRRMLTEEGVEADIVGLRDVSSYPEPREDGQDFEANALIKARAGFAATGMATLADDSGIEVDVLNKMPGVRSARWAGVGASDQDNLDLLVAQVSDVEPPHRTARFVCAMALVSREGEIALRGVVEGSLAKEPRGDHGFGYDPIFLPEGCRLTTAEMGPLEKDSISHRGEALRMMIPHIVSLTSGEVDR